MPNRFVANAGENPPEWDVWDTDCFSGEMQVRVAVCLDETTAIMVAKGPQPMTKPICLLPQSDHASQGARK